MCRQFAYISNSEFCLLEDVLVRPKHSIVKQVNEHYLPKLFVPDDRVTDEQQRADHNARNMYFNDDGTGVTYYTYTREEFGEASGPRPLTYKTIQPPINDPNFASLVANTSALCVFAHVRMATSAVHAYNNHPFSFGRHILMHNGAVTGFTQIRQAVCALMSKKAYEHVTGSTDSEHVFGLYMTFLAPEDDWERSYPAHEMKRAMDKTLGTIMTLQRQIFGTPQASSYNVCITDGERMIATRFRNHKTQNPPSLYWSMTAGVLLNRKYPGHPDSDTGLEGADLTDGNHPNSHGKHVIVVSEPTTCNEAEWELIPKNMIVVVDEHMKMTIEHIEPYTDAEGRIKE